MTIILTDERSFVRICTIRLNGDCHRHNCRYWSQTNPFWVREQNALSSKTKRLGMNIKQPIDRAIFIDANLKPKEIRPIVGENKVSAIGRRGSIERSARSPQLSLLNLFL